ncbi:hypothetical protein G3480_24805 [Thiorhodococcus mannitoliphagus]|uniref:Uncharacterized protein n=1 Tax=Thiorhodococcus mannitoliphagus TaxID=329406 RepID=A0A6P1E101_9GAMM|nr:hypothetical protein [Thiorhodococcus mannitoliphagus]NEX23470.1 hypothetical protein [Thiorhodococcus mannitoliphagus]
MSDAHATMLIEALFGDAHDAALGAFEVIKAMSTSNFPLLQRGQGDFGRPRSHRATIDGHLVSVNGEGMHMRSSEAEASIAVRRRCALKSKILLAQLVRFGKVLSVSRRKPLNTRRHWAQ